MAVTSDLTVCTLQLIVVKEYVEKGNGERGEELVHRLVESGQVRIEALLRCLQIDSRPACRRLF